MDKSKNKAHVQERPSKKKIASDGKSKSDPTPSSTSGNVLDDPLQSICVVGKSCTSIKLKPHESIYRLHECQSETALYPFSESPAADIVPVEGEVGPSFSNISFLSAQSGFSDADALHKKSKNLEEEGISQNEMVENLDRELVKQKDLTDADSVSTETDTEFSKNDEYTLKLKVFEKRLGRKEKKINDLNKKLEECHKVNDKHVQENKDLSHQVNVLNRQLQSMYEFVGQKNWNKTMETEVNKYISKINELESFLSAEISNKKHLQKEVEHMSTTLESKEKELNSKSREFLDYKNKSTLELCKLVNQIDCLQKEAKIQSQVLDVKIMEAQREMDEEIVNVTLKLEDQYQKDVKSATEKLQSDFERLADLPKSAIEKLLLLCESDRMDLIEFQKEWNKQQTILESKISLMQSDHDKELKLLKESYESKIELLKTQIDTLISQLKERKEILDIFENELEIYKSTSSLNLKRMSSRGDDISSLKEMYNAEIVSQKQVHKFQMNLFEEKVKTLTEEILYHSKNEEIHLQELENARKMAYSFREKYEQLLVGWEERMEKSSKLKESSDNVEFDSVFDEFRNLIESLKKSEEVYEKKIIELQTCHNDEISTYIRDVETFKKKLLQLENFQKAQTKLDETIQDLIKTLKLNYTKTVDALLASHETEMNLKKLEIYSLEKLFSDEVTFLKNNQSKELTELQNKFRHLDHFKSPLEKERDCLKDDSEEVKALKRKIEDLSLELLKHEGMIAIKEETEQALTDRIKALEEMLEVKEKNCKKELEDLVAKFLQVKVLSEAKDDLTKELEDELSNSEKILKKSCQDVEKLFELCSSLEAKTNNMEKCKDDEKSADFKINFSKIQEAGSHLEIRLSETLEMLNSLLAKQSSELKLISQKSSELKEEKEKVLEEYEKLRMNNYSLIATLNEKEKALIEMTKENKKRIEADQIKMEKLEELEAKRNEILLREELVMVERDEVAERNEILEEKVRNLNERINTLVAELANNKGPEEEIFSISLQEVRVLYEEEHVSDSDIVNTASASTATCHVEIMPVEGEVVTAENEKCQSEAKIEELKMESKPGNFPDVEVEVAQNTKDGGLLSIIENLEEEKKCLKNEIDNLREENYGLRASCEANIKILSETACCSFEEDSMMVCQMRKEIGKLSEYIKTLSTKLEVMKANNEILINESQEHLRQNQTLVNELEEAWSQRYEIEDQLAKVRKENALLNLHRSQLEKTNERISNLVAEGKPSVVSWIKIHETVENIIEEVLALKTSFSDSASGVSSEFNVAKTTSELKIMAETLHSQLQNKTVLCDQLMVQKKNLEKERERLSKSSESSATPRRNFGSQLGVRKRHMETHGHQSIYPLEKRPMMDFDVKSPDHHLTTLNKLKKHLEDQTERKEAQFRETLELQVKGLNKEILKLEEGLKEKSDSSKRMVMDEDRSFELLETQYEQEVLELTKEFEREVEKLRQVFAQESEKEIDGTITDEARGKYLAEIENLKAYFEGKWADLENRYQEIYKKRRKEKLELEQSQPNEQSQIVNEFLRILLEEKENEAAQRNKAQIYLSEILKRHAKEVECLETKYKESLNEIENNHVIEIQNLKTVVSHLKENILLALSKEEEGKIDEETKEKSEGLLRSLQKEYEEKLEKEKEKWNDLLEEAKQKHEREMSALEEFWTEKLSECETKCAIMKATGEGKQESRSLIDEEPDSEQKKEGFKENKIKEIKDFSPGFRSQLKSLTLEVQPQKSICSSCLENQTYYEGMEVKTDDDKLEIVKERDALKEAVSSLRYVVAKLLSFIGQHKSELNSTFDNEETMYKSLHLDLDNTADCSIASSAVYALDLTSIVQEISENSFLNSSDQVRFELDKCLKQLKKEATNLLALSRPDTTSQNLKDLIRRFEKEKNSLEEKVNEMEEMQKEMKKEIKLTKEKVSQWERNLEVVSEGYGEEVIEPKKVICLSDFKDKIKLFLTDQPQEINLLDEICKEGDRLLEEWKREKYDLQQQGRCSKAKRSCQIEVADKQLHSFKKFIEEQAAEREQEREAFDKEISHLKESLKAKDRDNVLQNRTNREGELHDVVTLDDSTVEALEAQLKELNVRLSDSERDKVAIETEFQNAVKKIWSLREVIQELEIQLAEVGERELNLKKKNERLEVMLEEQIKFNREIKEELETCKSTNEAKYTDHIKNLEEELSRLRRLAEQIAPETFTQLKASLRDIEGIIMRKTKDLEQLAVSSVNVSCSSPSEEVSLRDQFDATRCSTPEEMTSVSHVGELVLPIEEIDRVHEKLAKHNRAEEAAMKCIKDLKMRMRNDRKAFEEIQTERDILLDKVDVYLKENSSLKVRLEEQRCNAGLLQKQLNANLESQISRLEIDVEKLNELCVEKDKQLRDIREILENTTKALKVKETEVLNKSREENSLISTLKTDLGNALSEKQKLEEKMEKMKEKLKESMQMPALIDSMIDEKNAEIDRLEKEVVRLSEEISSFADSKSQDSKNVKRTKFSEPDSFGDCISSISAQNPSIIRNCSDSYCEMKHSPFSLRQPFQSTKLESVSSIGPLQLSPRGTDPSIYWKTSSPIVTRPDEIKNQSRSSPIKSNNDLEKIIEESKLKTEIETKQREILELHLEIDILKRQLVEVNQELAIARSQYKEAQNDIMMREEEIKKLQNNEETLMMTMDTLKKNHMEEVEELQAKLDFEHGKVEKVYEEIKALEMKKIEIEQAFLSLKEDYNEKLNVEQKASEALMAEVKDLEAKNEKLAEMKENVEKEFYQSCQKLAQEIVEVKNENEKLKVKYLNLTRKSYADAEVQVEEKGCEICKKSLDLENTEVKSEVFKDNIEKLRKEFEKLAEVLSEKDFGKKEAFSYAMVVRKILSSILGNVDSLQQELEEHRKKVMECSVDDLASKVKKELVLSAKLDNELLSSIAVNGFESKASQKDSSYVELGGGDNTIVVSQEAKPNAIEVCKELMNKIGDLEKEKEVLMDKIMQQENVIEQLEERLANEKERIMGEKERCSEDAKIMELLRVNLEKSLADLKVKEKDLKKEKQLRMALEKEIEGLKKNRNEPESKKLSDFKSQLGAQKEKLVSLTSRYEDEKRKNQELRLLLEQNRIERMSEKGTQRMLESDLMVARDQKESLKAELMNTRKLLDSRNVEIGVLKRKINLQEIDIKALSLSNNFHHQTSSEASSVIKVESFDGDSLKGFQRQSLPVGAEMSPGFIDKMKKLNTCVQHHLKESNDMEEALLYLSRETEQMREMIKKLEETENKSTDETLIADFDLDKRLWALEKGALIMEIENLKKELDVLKQKLIQTCKNNELLKQENSKLVREIKSAKECTYQTDNTFLENQMTYLTRRCMRAESHRKALAWQKNYLMIIGSEYRKSEEEACKKLSKLSGRRRRSQKHPGKFRVVVLAVIAIHRMQYIVKRWKRNVPTSFYLHETSSRSSNGKQKLSSLASVLNIYSEPVNPLSYQTQNIIRPSSKILRTPPSRDPGLQSYSLDVRKVSDCLETYNNFKENIGTAKILQ